MTPLAPIRQALFLLEGQQILAEMQQFPLIRMNSNECHSNSKSLRKLEKMF